MSSAATVAYGLLVKNSGTSIAEITDASDFGVERDDIEVTNLSSPDQAKEFIAGLIDAGTLTLAVNYLPANATHQALIANLIATSPVTLLSITVVMTDSGASVIGASFYVKSFKATAAVAGKLAATFVLKGTGPVTFPS